MYMSIGASFLITLLSVSKISVHVCAEENEIFKCDFKDDVCGIVNQVGMRAKWTQATLDEGDRKGLVMLVNTTGEKKQLARMITPYFEEHSQTQGCLSLHLFLSGAGVSFFRVEEQTDSGFQRLVSIRTQTSHWRSFDLPVRISEYVRFLFEAQVNPSNGKITVAVDNIVFKLGACPE